MLSVWLTDEVEDGTTPGKSAALRCASLAGSRSSTRASIVSCSFPTGSAAALNGVSIVGLMVRSLTNACSRAQYSGYTFNGSACAAFVTAALAASRAVTARFFGAPASASRA
eukprot:scaffold45807_cov56-Phaeocystis_antarctica.AAC.4